MEKNKLYTVNKWNRPLFGNRFEIGGQPGFMGYTWPEIQNAYYGMSNKQIQGLESPINAMEMFGNQLPPLMSNGELEYNFSDIKTPYLGNQNILGPSAQQLAIPDTNINPIVNFDRTPTAGLNPWVKLANQNQMGLDAYKNSKNLFGLSKANNPLSKGNIAGGLKAMTGTTLGNVGLGIGASLASGLAYKGLSGGFDTGAGSAINGIGNMAGNIVGQFNPALGAAITVGSGVLGGTWNHTFGMKTNKDALNNYNNALASWNNYTSNANSYDQIQGPENFSFQNIYKGGWARGHDARQKNRNALANFNAAKDFAYRSMDNNIYNIGQNSVEDYMRGYGAALGGSLKAHGGNLFPDGGPEYPLIKNLRKLNDLEFNNLVKKAKNEDWENLVYQARPEGTNLLGYDEDGNPIETIINGYAPVKLRTFYPLGNEYPVTGHSELEVPISDNVIKAYGLKPDYAGLGENQKIIVSKKGSDLGYNLITNDCADATSNYLNQMYGKSNDAMFFTTPGDVRDYAVDKLGGKKTYEDGIETVLIPRNARNADAISEKALLLSTLKDPNFSGAQIEGDPYWLKFPYINDVRYLNGNKYVENQHLIGGNLFNNGGGIHIDPSKKGTFTAAASKHGMGVQEFASKVLSNKEDYSSAMVKKANFARNASKWHGLGGNLYPYGGYAATSFLDDFSQDPIAAVMKYNQMQADMAAQREAMEEERAKEEQMQNLQKQLMEAQTNYQGLQSLYDSQATAIKNLQDAYGNISPIIPPGANPGLLLAGVLSDALDSKGWSTGTLPKNNKNWNYIKRKLKASGKFTDTQIDGIGLNLMRESRFDPEAIGDGGSAFGIAQWHGNRKPKDKTLDGQITHLINTLSEFDGKEHWIGRKNYNGFMNARTPEEAHYYIANGWERPKAVITDSLRREMNNSLINAGYAFGGELGTNGTDWYNGLLQVNEGNSHEMNPLGGVPMGVDQQGTPNLVEEGETVFNKYVFSRRKESEGGFNVPLNVLAQIGIKPTKKQLKEGISYAEASKVVAKESEERPMDDTSQRGLEHGLGLLAQSQEQQRQERQAMEQAMQQGYAALGGRLCARGGILGNRFDGIGDRPNYLYAFEETPNTLAVSNLYQTSDDFNNQWRQWARDNYMINPNTGNILNFQLPEVNISAPYRGNNKEYLSILNDPTLTDDEKLNVSVALKNREDALQGSVNRTMNTVGKNTLEAGLAAASLVNPAVGAAYSGVTTGLGAYDMYQNGITPENALRVGLGLLPLGVHAPQLGSAAKTAASNVTKGVENYALKHSNPFVRFMQDVSDRYKAMKMAGANPSSNLSKFERTWLNFKNKGVPRNVKMVNGELRVNGHSVASPIDDSGIAMHLGGGTPEGGEIMVDVLPMEKSKQMQALKFVNSAPPRTVVGETSEYLPYIEQYAGSKNPSIVRAIGDAIKGTKVKSPSFEKEMVELEDIINHPELYGATENLSNMIKESIVNGNNAYSVDSYKMMHQLANKGKFDLTYSPTPMGMFNSQGFYDKAFYNRLKKLSPKEQVNAVNKWTWSINPKARPAYLKDGKLAIPKPLLLTRGFNDAVVTPVMENASAISGLGIASAPMNTMITYSLIDNYNKKKAAEQMWKDMGPAPEKPFIPNDSTFTPSNWQPSYAMGGPLNSPYVNLFATAGSLDGKPEWWKFLKNSVGLASDEEKRQLEEYWNQNPTPTEEEWLASRPRWQQDFSNFVSKYGDPIDYFFGENIDKWTDKQLDDFFATEKGKKAAKWLADNESWINSSMDFLFGEEGSNTQESNMFGKLWKGATKYLTKPGRKALKRAAKISKLRQARYNGARAEHAAAQAAAQANRPKTDSEMASALSPKDILFDRYGDWVAGRTPAQIAAKERIGLGLLGTGAAAATGYGLSQLDSSSPDGQNIHRYTFPNFGGNDMATMGGVNQLTDKRSSGFLHDDRDFLSSQAPMSFEEASAILKNARYIPNRTANVPTDTDTPANTDATDVVAPTTPGIANTSGQYGNLLPLSPFWTSGNPNVSLQEMNAFLADRDFRDRFAAGVNPKSTQSTSTEDNNTGVKTYDTWMRYAPVFGSGILTLTDLLGLTSKPDYTYANKLEAYANRAGYTPNIGAPHIGDYMRYIPTDRQYMTNLAMANARATDRNLMNLASGNRAQAMAGILSNGYNTTVGLGNIFRGAEDANYNRYATALGFNRGTNQFNAQQALQAALANAQYRTSGIQLGLSGLAQAAQMRAAQDAMANQARSANITNLLQSLSNIGRENFALNQIASNRAFDWYYGDTSGFAENKKRARKNNNG